MIEKMFSVFWNIVNPQKNLDEHYEKIRKDKISKPLKEQMMMDVTRAKIVCSYWTLLLFTMALASIVVYFGKP